MNIYITETGFSRQTTTLDGREACSDGTCTPDTGPRHRRVGGGRTALTPGDRRFAGGSARPDRFTCSEPDAARGQPAAAARTTLTPEGVRPLETGAPDPTGPAAGLDRWPHPLQKSSYARSYQRAWITAFLGFAKPMRVMNMKLSSMRDGRRTFPGETPIIGHVEWNHKDA